MDSSNCFHCGDGMTVRVKVERLTKFKDGNGNDVSEWKPVSMCGHCLANSDDDIVPIVKPTSITRQADGSLHGLVEVAEGTTLMAMSKSIGTKREPPRGSNIPFVA